jgi:hypothetical protein
MIAGMADAPSQLSGNARKYSPFATSQGASLVQGVSAAKAAGAARIIIAKKKFLMALA